MNALVIGGTGLISTALVRQLVERGDDVTVYNRGRAGISLPSSVRRLAGDRTDSTRFALDMQEAGTFDCVFDMICYQPQEAASLIRAFSKRAGRVVIAGTVDAYVKPADTYPVREDAPLGGVNPYGRGKAECEKLLLAAHHETNFPATILRLVHCYGPGGVHRGHIVHSLGGRTILLDRLKKGKPVIVHGDGSSLWTSCHIEDVARAFIQSAESVAALGNAYNLGGDETVTWDEYHRLLTKAMDAPVPEIVHIPTDLLVRLWPERAAAAGDNFRFNNVFDNSAAKRDFGFRYTIPLSQGLRDTIAWVEATYGFDNADGDPFYDELIAVWKSAVENLAAQAAGKREKR